MPAGAIVYTVFVAWMVIGIAVGTMRAMRAPGARPWLVLPCGLLAIYGFGGFLGQAMGNMGALGFVPRSVELPVWRPEVHVRTKRDLTFVGLATVKRVQVYDASGRFLYGFFVPTLAMETMVPAASSATMDDVVLSDKPPVNVDWSAPWWPLASPPLGLAVGAVGMLGIGGRELAGKLRSMRDRRAPASRW